MLGFSVEGNGIKVELHNLSITGRLFRHFNIGDDSPLSTLLPPGLDLSIDDAGLLVDAHTVQAVGGIASSLSKHNTS